MKKYIVKIEGMSCGMCEAHVADTIRNTFPNAKKVTASRKSGEASFLFDGEIDARALEDAISQTGYRFVSVTSVDHIKRGLFAK